MNSKQKLSDRVRERIHEDIRNNTYKKGDRIPSESKLMEIYEVGRSTVREAVRDLTLAGVLRVQQGIGTTVVGVNEMEPLDRTLMQGDFKDINAVRNLLEREIIVLAVTHRTAADVEVLKQHLAMRIQAIKAEDKVACMHADLAFHIALADASGNKVLTNLYLSFTNVIRDFFEKREGNGVTRFALTHHLHEQLLQAIIAQDAQQALMVQQHILDNNY